MNIYYRMALLGLFCGILVGLPLLQVSWLGLLVGETIAIQCLMLGWVWEKQESEEHVEGNHGLWAYLSLRAKRKMESEET